MFKERTMKILLIGSSVRAFAESAVRSGYRIVALDAFGDRDLKRIAEAYSLPGDFHLGYAPDNLYKASRKLIFDHVAYTSNLENHPGIIARFAGDHRIIGNAAQVVTSIRHWPVFFEKLEKAGFPTPKTFFERESLATDSKCKWLLKPFLSGGGHGIRYCNPWREDPLEDESRFKAEHFMFQEYIPGRSCSASFVTNGTDSVVLGIAEQLIGLSAFGSRDFLFCGNLLPLPEMVNPDTGKHLLNEVRRLTDFLSREFGLIGVNGIDFILRDGQVYLTEVNPRYSASMELMEIAYGLPIFHLHVQAALNSELPEFDPVAQGRCNRFYGKSYMYAEKDVTIPDTGGWIERNIGDVPEQGEIIRKGGPICTIRSEGATRDLLLSEMTRTREALKEEING